MSITVSRCAYENGVNNLRIEGVKSMLSFILRKI